MILKATIMTDVPVVNLSNYAYTPQSANKKIVQITQGIHEKMRNIIPERYKYIINAAMIKPLTTDVKNGAVTDVCCRTSFLWREETDGWDRDLEICYWWTTNSSLLHH